MKLSTDAKIVASLIVVMAATLAYCLWPVPMNCCYCGQQLVTRPRADVWFLGEICHISCFEREHPFPVPPMPNWKFKEE